MASRPKQKCKYGAGCYRKNPQHQDTFEHSNSKEDESSPYNSDTDDKKASENKENRVDLSKTLEIKPDNDDDLDAMERIDLSNIENIKALVDEYNNQMPMPCDFYEFLDFCKSINHEDPKNALKAAGLELAGIYDVVTLGLKVDYRLHSRYFYDVPEFQTLVVVKDSPNMMHFGYFRDDPNELPGFVGMNEAKTDCKIHCKGDNIFAAINWYFDELMNNRIYKSSLNIDQVKSLKNKLAHWCDEHHKSDKTFSLQLKTPKTKLREKKINCKTFHGAGICVPVDSRGFGYRDVPETEDKQKKMFENFCLESENDKDKRGKALEKIQEIITLIQFANDETDYGMGIEFGVNMFCYGDLKLHRFMKSTIIVSYKLLGRDLYADILIEHLKNRKLKL